MFMKVAIATAVTLAIAAPAAAAEPLPSDSATIRFGDLDLSSGKGFAALNRRIDKAADRICGVEPRSLFERSINHECRADVVGQAHDKLRGQITGMQVQVAQR